MAISNKNIFKSVLLIVFIVTFITYLYSNIHSYYQSNSNIYRVQIAASLSNRIPIDSLASFYNLNETIREDSLNGWYKYSVGNFKSYQEATNYKNTLVELNNIKDAFVISIKEETKIKKTINSIKPVQKLRYYKRPVTLHQKTIVSQKYTYKVQVGASKVNIPIDSLRNILKVDESINVEIGEWFRYTIGNYNTFIEAKNYCNVLANNGNKNAFVVSYINNQRTNSIIVPQKKLQIPYHRKVLYTYIKKDQYKSQKKQTIPKYKKPIIIPKSKVRNISNYPVIKKDLVIYHTSLVDLSSLKKNILKQSEINRTQYQPIVGTENINYKRGYIPRTGNVVNILPTDTMKYKPYQNSNIKKKSYVATLIEKDSKSRFGLIILILIFYLAFNFILVTVIIFISRISKNQREKRIKKLEEEFQTLLAEYLFDSNIQTSAFNRLNIINSRFKRNILIDEIMKLSVDMSGEVLDSLRELYFKCTLEKDSLRKLRDRRWHIKVKGCRELTRMKAFKAKDEIERMLNSKNEIIRVEAQIAMIELNEENPYYFLDKLTKPFLRWEQLNVHVLIQRNGYEVPDFSKWLRVSNETVVLFALEMIRIYKQISNAPRLVNFFEHPNLKIREAAIRAVGEVGYIDSLPDLRRIYNYSDDEFKNLVLKTMQLLPEDSNKDFLKNIMESRSHKRFKLDAAKAMASLGVRGQVELKKLAQASDDEMVSIVNHVFDKRI